VSTTFFEELLEKHGNSPRSLDWSPEGQASRFHVLLEAGIDDDQTVVDVGCGLGHLADFLFDFVDVQKYIGIDVSTKMIEAAIATERNVGDVTFLVRDAFKEPIPEGDFVVSSGMLNLLQSDSSSLHMFLKRCFDACRIGCAVNMLSMLSPEKRPDRVYRWPDSVLHVAFSITPYVTLRHDYRENDFTIQLYRRPCRP
jgi:SAM-dependent methyltransferase